MPNPYVVNWDSIRQEHGEDCDCSFCDQYEAELTSGVEETILIPSCSICDTVTDETAQLHFGGLACQECFVNGRIIFCYICGSYCSVDEGRSWYGTVFNGMRSVCEGCVDNTPADLVNCYICNNEFPSILVDINSNFTHGTLPDGEHYYLCFSCSDSHRSCNICSGPSNPASMRMMYDNGTNRHYICVPCSRELNQCSRCRYFNQTEFCVRCSRNLLHSYSYKPDTLIWLRFPTERKTEETLFFGFEVELACVRGNRLESVYWVHHNEDWLYCKKDSSINPEGFELVSHPFTHRWIMVQSDNLKYLFSNLKKRGMKANRSCGMHVHVSRDAFNKLHSFKWQRLFNSNSSLIRGVSDRDPERFRRWSPFRTDAKEEAIRIAKTQKTDSQTQSDGRSACTVRRNTFEIRLFSSTTDADVVLNRINFLKSVYDFTKISPLTNSMSVDYMYWLKERKEKYERTIKLLEKIFPFKSILKNDNNIN